MKIIKAKPGDYLGVGRQDEKNAIRVEFDITEWERLYGYGVVQLLVHRMGDEDFYPVAIEQAKGVVGWVVTVPENSVEGRYHTYELRYYAGETLAKSAIGQYSVQRSFVGTEAEPPEAHEGWVDQIIATGAGSLAAQKAAEAARDEADERAKNASESAEAAALSERNAIEAARQAELSKNGIVQAEVNASRSASNAEQSAESAQRFMSGAEASRGQAQAFAQSANNSSKLAEESAANAEDSEQDAKQHATNAKESKEAAARSEAQAKQYAAEAKSTASAAAPTVDLVDITGGTRVKITDVNGVHAFDVLDGQSVFYCDEAARGTPLPGSAFVFSASSFVLNGRTLVTGDLAVTKDGYFWEVVNPAREDGDVALLCRFLLKGEKGDAGDSLFYCNAEFPRATVGALQPLNLKDFAPDYTNIVVGSIIISKDGKMFEANDPYMSDRDYVMTTCLADLVGPRGERGEKGESVFHCDTTFPGTTVGSSRLINVNPNLIWPDHNDIVVGSLVISTDGLMWKVTTVYSGLAGEGFKATCIADLKGKKGDKGDPGGVQSVNGQFPDENGNVEIDSVASWNDLTDKPFGETKEVVEILPECQPIYVEGSETPFIFTTPVELTIGGKYIVNWNGVDYASTAYDGVIAGFSGAVALVNDGADMNTGEGAVFLICFLPVADEGAYGFAQSFDGSTSVTISIRQEQTTITPLPAKYLPKGMGYIEEGGMMEILPETTLTSPEEEPGEFTLTENPPVLKVGDRYIVTWNGVEYGGTAVDASEMMGAGSVMVANDDANIETGEGAVFGIIYMPDVGNGQPALYIMDFADSSATVTLSIKGEDVAIHKLDNRCLDLAWLPTTVNGTVLSTCTVNGFISTVIGFVWVSDCVGKTYTVDFNGERYECVCRSFSAEGQTVNYIGNMNVSGNYPDVDTGEPFCVQSLAGQTFVGKKNTGSAEITVYGPTYSRMPDSFLPAGLFVDGAESFVLTSAPDADGNRHKFRISVNGSGQLVTTKATE